MNKKICCAFLIVLPVILAMLPTAMPQVFAEEGLSIVSYEVRPNAFVSSDFCRRLTALPEWEPFFTTFTDAVDKALPKELSRDRLNGKLPDEMIDDIQNVLDRGISSRRAVESFFEHVDVIVFELRADIDSITLGEGLDGLVKLFQSGKIDVKVGIDGVLGTVIDVNPRKLLPALKYLKEGKDYEFLRNEADGDFVLKFHFRFHDHKIGFCCAGVKIPNRDRYALLFSGKQEIDDYVKMFKDGKFAAVSNSPVKEVVLAEPCFLFLDREWKKTGLHSNESDFLSKIKMLKASFRDVDGVSQIDLSATMRSADDARQLRDLLNGLTALVRLTQNADSPAMKLLDSFSVDIEEEKVTVAAKLDNDELWKGIAEVLKKATKEIKKQL